MVAMVTWRTWVTVVAVTDGDTDRYGEIGCSVSVAEKKTATEAFFLLTDF